MGILNNNTSEWNPGPHRGPTHVKTPAQIAAAEKARKNLGATSALSDLQGAVNTERSGKPTITVNGAIEQVSKMNPGALSRAHAALKATGLNEGGVKAAIRKAVEEELARPSLIMRPRGGKRRRTHKRRTHKSRTHRRRN